MESFIKVWTQWAATGVEICAALIITAAAIQATVRSVATFLPLHAAPTEVKKQTIRLSLGRWLALALEFELAADVMRTAISPTWNEIGQLAAIILVRTFLNYFLQREISESGEVLKQETQTS